MRNTFAMRWAESIRAERFYSKTKIFGNHPNQILWSRYKSCPSITFQIFTRSLISPYITLKVSGWWARCGHIFKRYNFLPWSDNTRAIAPGRSSKVPSKISESRRPERGTSWHFRVFMGLIGLPRSSTLRTRPEEETR